jgi:hypothetical protein
MAKAFACDLCHQLQAGDPIVEHELKGTDSDAPQRVSKEQWCNDCLTTFSAWRAMRERVGADRLMSEADADLPVQERYA